MNVDPRRGDRARQLPLRARAARRRRPRRGCRSCAPATASCGSTPTRRPGAVARGPLVDALIAAGDLAVAPKQAWTPVAEFGQAGVAAVNFGPGDPPQAHTRDESISVAALVRSYRVLERFADRRCEALADPHRPQDVSVRAPDRRQARAPRPRRRRRRLRHRRAARGHRAVHPRAPRRLADAPVDLPAGRGAARAARGGRRVDRAPLRADARSRTPRSSPRSAPRRRSSTSPRSSAATSWPSPRPATRSPSAAPRSRASRCSSSSWRPSAASSPTSTPSTPPPGTAPRSCGSTTRTTRPPRARRSSSTSAPPRSRASTTSSSPPTRPTRRSTSARCRRSRRSRSADRRNVIALNTLSKRSSMPGYRSGFVAGDPDVIAALKRYRPNVGVAPPEFIQRAAVAAWGDEEHVEDVRALYRAKRDVLLPVFEAGRHLPRGRRRDVLPLARRRRARRPAGRRAARARRRARARARSSAPRARASCASRWCRRSPSASARPSLLASVVGVQGGVEAGPGA